MFHVQISHATCRLCKLKLATGANEYEDFVEFYRYIVVACLEDFLVIVVVASEAEHLHLLRKIYVATVGVLLVYGRYHDAVADEELVFDLTGALVASVLEAKRLYVHSVVLDRVTEVPDDIRHQSMPKLY